MIVNQYNSKTDLCSTEELMKYCVLFLDKKLIYWPSLTLYLYSPSLGDTKITFTQIVFHYT